MKRLLPMMFFVLSLSGTVAVAKPSWNSGVNGSNSSSFATWRGFPLGLATGWAPWDSWSNMLSYMSGSSARNLRQVSSNVSIGVGLFPKSGGNLADCAAGKYAANHRSIGSRLVANGLGDAEIRLGWEANNDSYPWTAVGKPAEQWRACFTNAAKAIKEGGSTLRISWHMAKKGRVDVNTLWPDDAPITNVGVSHYDDGQSRFGMETFNGSPWGLRAWLAFAVSKGKQLEMAEWGAGRLGDNPIYVQNMYDFFRDAGSNLAHEGYFNARVHQIYSTTSLPKSSAIYRQLF